MNVVQHTWTLRGGRDLGPAPFFVMGIVNLTPDSFYDGGSYTTVAQAVAHAAALTAAGADILDFGAESTRPGSLSVSADVELARLLPVLTALQQVQTSAAPALSVDTRRAVVAAAALEHGADIINDVSGVSLDPAMPDVLQQFQPGYVLMHSPAPSAIMQERAQYDDVLATVLDFFEKRLALLVRAGLSESCIVLDPGIGFGKTAAQNMALLRAIPHLCSFGRPVLLGFSHKSVFGELLDIPSHERKTSTQVLTALCAREGACIHRVHDVLETRRTLALLDNFYCSAVKK